MFYAASVARPPLTARPRDIAPPKRTDILVFARRRAPDERSEWADKRKMSLQGHTLRTLSEHRRTATLLHCACVTPHSHTHTRVRMIISHVCERLYVPALGGGK